MTAVSGPLSFGLSGRLSGPAALDKGGWWRAAANKLDNVAPAFFLDFAPQRFVVDGVHAAIDTAVTLSNASTIRTKIDADLKIRKAAANMLRVTHKNGRSQALLEGTATGLQGAETNPNLWYPDGGAGRTSYSTAFGDLANGVRIASAGGYWHRYSRPCMAAATVGQKFAFSAVVKPGTSGSFYLGVYNGTASKGAGIVPSGADWTAPIVRDNGAGAISKMQSVALADGVYLVSFVLTFADAATSGGWTFGVGPNSDTSGADVIVYAMQVEVGDEPSSLIHNDGDGQVTRTADLADLHSSAGDMTAWAFRGYVPSRVVNWQTLIGIVGNTYFSGDDNNPARVGLFGQTDSSGVILDPPCIPGYVNFCGGWGPSGRRLAVSGGVAGADSKVPDRSRSRMFIGSTEGGLPHGVSIYLDELVGWILPDRPSASGVQSQARVAA